MSVVLEVSSLSPRNLVVVIAGRLYQSLTLNERMPDDFFDLCPIGFLNGEADSDIHYDVRHLHQNYKQTFQSIRMVYTNGYAREYLVEKESSLHDEHKAYVAEEPAYFSCALFDLLSVFVRAKLIQSLLMIPSQFPVNIDVS